MSPRGPSNVRKKMNLIAQTMINQQITMGSCYFSSTQCLGRSITVVNHAWRGLASRLKSMHPLLPADVFSDEMGILV
jgi:hypothetical protein